MSREPDPSARDRQKGGLVSLSAGVERFVGRVREQGELATAVKDAFASRGRLLMITGEPGVGKTRLCDETAAVAHGHGFEVAWGRCWEGGGAPPYWPWVQVLRTCARLVDAQTLSGFASMGTLYLSNLVPEMFGSESAVLGSKPELLAPRAVAGLGSQDTETLRFQLFDSMGVFLRNFAEHRPLAIILDDLHAADQESILLLHFLVQDLRKTRLLVLVTYRDTEVRLAPRLAQVLGEISREAQTITLTGLSRNDVGESVALSAGTKPDEST